MGISTKIAVIAAAVTLVPASLAGAKAPPKGTYECTISGMLFGDVVIKSGDRYKRNGKKGRFKHGGTKVTFSDGRKGWRISFKSGSFKGFKGRWYRTTDGYEIALKNPEDGFESIYCVKN